MKRLLLIVGLILLVSCGSRKTNKTKIESKLETNIDLTVDKKIENKETKQNDIAEVKKSEIQNNIEEKKTSAKPLDPKKPMKKTQTKTTIGNKTIEENVWENAEITEESKIDNSKKTYQSEIIDKSKIESEKLEAEKAKLKINNKKEDLDLIKNSEAKRGFNLLWLLFLLIIPLGIYIYYKYIK